MRSGWVLWYVYIVTNVIAPLSWKGYRGAFVEQCFGMNV
jgi:hypothetical protein